MILYNAGGHGSQNTDAWLNTGIRMLLFILYTSKVLWTPMATGSVISKAFRSLDYLAGLGLTCTWLLPFFPSPNRDHGYDIADYLNVDPKFHKFTVVLGSWC